VLYIIERGTNGSGQLKAPSLLKYTSGSYCLSKGLNKTEIIFETLPPVTFVGRFRLRSGFRRRFSSFGTSRDINFR
jgi:hypothetical protein